MTMVEGYWIHEDLAGEEYYEAVPLHVTVEDRDEEVDLDGSRETVVERSWSGEVIEYDFPYIYFEQDDGQKFKLSILPSETANRLSPIEKPGLAEPTAEGCYIELLPLDEVTPHA